MLASKILVDVPEDSGVHVKTAGKKGEKYVYKYVEYFRNSAGAPRNRARSIGKFDPGTGKMHPNSRYYEIYNIETTLPDISIFDYGYAYLALKVCRDTGLLECLMQAFGARGAMEIAVMASYIVREGNAMDAIDDWQERNYFPGFDRRLTSQSTSRAFASITNAQTDCFFRHWVKRAYSGGSVCYDVTSISSYSSGMASVERGYNRDGDDLCQYNLGMFCDEGTKAPLYYSRYNGSLTDRTNLPYVLASARSLGIKHVKMIVDGGFWREECFKSLAGCCDSFTMGMPAFLKESGEIISKYAGGIEKYANELDCRHVYCVELEATIYGVPGKVLLFYDSWNHLNLSEELSNRIERLKAELAALKRFPKGKLGRYTPYFTITEHEKGNGFDYAVDTRKVDELRGKKGFFLLFSTEMEAAPSDILYYYRAKDADEKIFSQIKVDMDGGRARTHNEGTTDGKTFVTFIACAIRSDMFGKMSKFLKENSTSMKKALNQMSNITIVSSSEGLRFTKALTKKQKQILSAFNAEDDIMKSIDPV